MNFQLSMAFGGFVAEEGEDGADAPRWRWFSPVSPSFKEIALTYFSTAISKGEVSREMAQGKTNAARVLTTFFGVSAPGAA
jgi:hypothetical protein